MTDQSPDEQVIPVSHSMLATLRTCQRKFELKYEKRIVPIVKDIKLEEGILMHDCLQLYYQGKPKDEMLAHFDAKRKEYEDTLDKQLAAKKTTEEKVMAWKAKLVMARIVAENYARIAPKLDKDYVIRPEDVEVWWTLRVKSKDDPKIVYLFRGKFDARATDREGHLFLYEHKYTNMFSQELMDLDHQLSMYCLAEFLRCKQVPTVIYNVIRKPDFEIKKTENLQQFEKRVYSQIIARADSGVLVERHMFSRSKRMLDIFVDELKGTLAYLQPGHYRYRTDDRLHCKRFCPYPLICLDENPAVVNAFFTVAPERQMEESHGH